jgi:hypothetical protein
MNTDRQTPPAFQSVPRCGDRSRRHRRRSCRLHQELQRNSWNSRRFAGAWAGRLRHRIPDHCSGRHRHRSVARLASRISDRVGGGTQIRQAESLDISRYKSGAVFFYTVFVDKSGDIMQVDSGMSDQNEAFANALKKVKVITPGMRNNSPVPTAVTLAIPVK